MNFKPTLWKSITSLLSGIVVNYFLIKNVTVLCDCVINTECICPQPTWLDHAFDSASIVISLIVIALVYVIWSFIQKK